MRAGVEKARPPKRVKPKPEKLKAKVPPGTLAKIEEARARYALATSGASMTFDQVVARLIESACSALVPDKHAKFVILDMDHRVCRDVPVCYTDHVEFRLLDGSPDVSWDVRAAKDYGDGAIELRTTHVTFAIYPRSGNVVLLTPARI